jgi:parvulin-like peptidyl-prolyl isomerase
MKKTILSLTISAVLAASLFSADSTLVTVNGTKITSDEVNQMLMEGTQGRFNSLPSDKQEELQKRVVDGLITQELVYGDAKKNGVLKSKEYKEAYSEVVKRIEKQLAAKVWEQQEFEKVKVTDKEIKDYFAKNSAEFVEKERVHARHILVKTEEEAKEITKTLKAFKGDKLETEFIKLAKEKSTGPSGPKGGDLGWFPKGQMVPEFNDAVFKMATKSVSEPIKTQFGYHVIYLEDKKDGKKLTLDEVKSFIDQKLKVEQFKTIMDKKMEALKSSAKITFN